MALDEGNTMLVLRTARVKMVPKLKAVIERKLPDPEKTHSHEVLWGEIGQQIIQMLEESIEEGTQNGYYAIKKAIHLMLLLGFISEQELSSLYPTTS